MGKWQRFLYQPVLPLGEDGRRVTGSEEHIRLSRRAAGEGMVLLKNQNDCLPLARGAKVALFGKGTIDYVKGGGGSGDVTVAYIRNLYDGMKQMESQGRVELFHELPQFYETEIARQFAEGAIPGMTREPALPEGLLEKARAAADTAVVSFCRFSGESWDRVCGSQDIPENSHRYLKMGAAVFERGDFYLSHAEETLLEAVCRNFPRVIVVMNVGGMVDVSWIRDNERITAGLMAWQGGMEGGAAIAEVLCGDVNPSGRLTDTFAATLEDYPSSDTFHESDVYVNYAEDIYVGYRYFGTLPGASSKVIYPFGFGLSYTNFSVSLLEACCRDDHLCFLIRITNTGARAGRDVLQIYYSAPQGKLGKPGRVLAAFGKTGLLRPGEEQRLTLSFPVSSMASYDDTGKVRASAWVLEPGDYTFFLGENVRDAAQISFVYHQDDVLVTEQLTPQAGPCQLPRRLQSDGSYEELPMSEPVEEPGLPRQDTANLPSCSPAVRGVGRITREQRKQLQPFQFLRVAEGQLSLDDFISQLDDDALIHLLGGQPNTGVANTYGMGNLPEYGVPNVMTADGPAGLRIVADRGVCTTAFPCATLLACTWDTALAEQIGAAAAEEVRENNIGIWLTPAMNIHRSPLCGRNFEYYSEDPLIAGKMAAALIRGIQSRHIGACAKHFACNNKETNRRNSDSRVSERALREIYLKPFEIAVKESQPYMIMSSYNLLNGVRASEHKQLLTNILRGEWGYTGMVTTDWGNFGEHYREAKAGNDIKMGTGYPERVREALDRGLITREEIAACAKRILEMILKLD